MRSLLIAAALLAAAPAFAEVDDADEVEAAAPDLHEGHTQALFTVGFPKGNPFPQKKLPELKVVDAETAHVVATVRPHEWTAKSATYAASVRAGRSYRLVFLQGETSLPFARLAVPADAAGSVSFRIPYVAPVAVAAAR